VSGTNQIPYPFFFFLAAIFNVDDSVVDLETLAALFENVSVKNRAGVSVFSFYPKSH
jgi:hypothetical protein